MTNDSDHEKDAPSVRSPRRLVLILLAAFGGYSIIEKAANAFNAWQKGPLVSTLAKAPVGGLVRVSCNGSSRGIDAQAIQIDASQSNYQGAGGLPERKWDGKMRIEPPRHTGDMVDRTGPLAVSEQWFDPRYNVCVIFSPVLDD